jgi:hypothetical protein
MSALRRSAEPSFRLGISVGIPRSSANSSEL